MKQWFQMGLRQLTKKEINTLNHPYSIPMSTSNSRIQIVVIVLFTALGFTSLLAQNTQVYVSAHPDDWQLFMNPNAYNDLENPDNKVIFLHTTAGDAGCGMGCTSYYLAREEGSLRAIRFMCNVINNQLKQGDSMNKTHVLINGHLILRYSYANAVAYFLRLPDGNYTGVGYPIHNHESLKYFYEGATPTLSTIDKSTAYQSLDDLVTTIRDLLNYEMNSTGQISLNIAETNPQRNPEDHSDHLT
ncbi:GlcNAc-PI de-N-acetylase [Flavobacteriaceae bacterium MAR_2010_105]|nr:GlcNAc-PI de-N-acetylase [Flavobacteriaceae bacterium MAR_2010_105]